MEILWLRAYVIVIIEGFRIEEENYIVWGEKLLLVIMVNERRQTIFCFVMYFQRGQIYKL
jgi:hypothetical protein